VFAGGALSASVKTPHTIGGESEGQL
jgi:hypothetical protein